MGQRTREQLGTTDSSEACISLNSSISAPGKLWPIHSVRVYEGVLTVSSEPPRRPTDSPSALMSDLQLGLVNTWVSTCGMDRSRSQHARPFLSTFFGLSSHMSDQSVHTYSYPCDTGSALTWFVSRDEGENLLISPKPTMKTVTGSAHGSPFVVPTGELSTDSSFSRL